MYNKEKLTPPGIMLVMCSGIGVMLFFLVLIGFASAPRLRVKLIKEEIIDTQVITIKVFEKHIDLLEKHSKVLDDEVKENKITLARACESRNTVHED